MCVQNGKNKRIINASSSLLELSDPNFRFVSGPNLRERSFFSNSNQNLRNQDRNSRLTQLANSSLIEPQNTSQTLTRSSNQEGSFYSIATLSQAQNQCRYVYLEERISKYIKNWLMKKKQTWNYFDYMLKPFLSCIIYLTTMSDLSARAEQEVFGGEISEQNSLSSNEIEYNQENHWYSRRLERRLRENYNNIDNGDNIDEIHVSEHEMNIAKIKLINVLKLSKIFNFVLAISHGLNLMKLFDIEFICYNLVLGRGLLYKVDYELSSISGGCSSKQHSSYENNNMTLMQATLVAGQRIEGRENKLIISGGEEYDTIFYYHLLIVSILDCLNNLFWYHSRKNIVRINLTSVNNRSRGITDTKINFRLQQITLFKSILLILSSPKHICQTIFIGLFLAIWPLGGSNGMAISLYNCFNQMLRNLYNLYRVVCYEREINKSIDKDDRHRSNESATIATYSDRQQSNSFQDDIINNNVSHEHEEQRLQQQQQQYISTSYLAKLYDIKTNEGLSHWPISLNECSCKLSNLSRHRFERVIMISQMLCVKVTVFALLTHIDGQKLTRNSMEGFMTFSCLIQSFLTMYFHYDKYYNCNM